MLLPKGIQCSRDGKMLRAETRNLSSDNQSQISSSCQRSEYPCENTYY